MNETIYGLKYDFEQQQGHFMTISRQDPSPIQSDELANIQVKMMDANKIDKVLPLEVQEIDFNVTFYYDISSKKMLSQYVREHGLTMNELYELLYHICAAMESSKEYMLNEQQFALHENFIFIGKDTKDIELTYLPLKDITQKPAIHAEFRELFFRLVGFVKALSGDGVQQLTSYLNGDDFQLKELMKKLDELRKSPVQESVTEQPWMKKTQYAAPTAQHNQAPKQEPVRRPIQTPEAEAEKPVAKKTKPEKQPKQKKQVEKPETEVEASEEQEKKGPSPVIVGSLGIFGLAIIWRIYQSTPTEGMLYISIGLSVGVFAIIYYFLAVFGKGKQSEPATEETTKAKKLEKQKKKKGIKPNRVDESAQPAVQPESEPKPVNSENYFQNLHQETTLLSQPEATVALDEESAAAQHGGAYLEADRNGQSEMIPLMADSFIIGRSESAVQYVEDTAGVSRTHIEFVTNGTSYVVKDLGSKNGSKMNGQQMVAYKTYPLHTGDQIRIAKVTYTFHEG